MTTNVDIVGQTHYALKIKVQYCWFIVGSGRQLNFFWITMSGIFVIGNNLKHKAVHHTCNVLTRDILSY